MEKIKTNNTLDAMDYPLNMLPKSMICFINFLKTNRKKNRKKRAQRVGLGIKKTSLVCGPSNLTRVLGLSYYYYYYFLEGQVSCSLPHFFKNKNKDSKRRRLISTYSSDRGRWKIRGSIFFNLKLIFNPFLPKTPQIS